MRDLQTIEAEYPVDAGAALARLAMLVRAERSVFGEYAREVAILAPVDANDPIGPVLPSHMRDAMRDRVHTAREAVTNHAGWCERVGALDGAEKPTTELQVLDRQLRRAVARADEARAAWIGTMCSDSRYDARLSEYMSAVGAVHLVVREMVTRTDAAREHGNCLTRT